MKLIRSYEHLDVRECLDCRIKSLKELVKHYDIHISSYEALILSEAIGFNYALIDIPALGIMDLAYCTPSKNHIEKSMFQNLGIKLKEIEIGASDTEWSYMRSLVDDDIPILVYMDSRFLTGQDKGSKSLNLYYVSTLLLVGYDDYHVYLVLTNTDECEQVFKLDIEQFQKHRRTEFIPFGPNEMCFFIPKGEEVIPEKKLQLESFTKSLVHICELMLSKETCDDYELGAFKCQSLMYGINGMMALKELLLEIVKTYDSQTDKELKTLQFQLLFIRNNNMFGSKSAFRDEFGKGLKELDQRFNMPIFQTLGDDFLTLGSKWRRFLVILTKCIHNIGSGRDYLEQAIEIWDEIITLESRAFKQVKNQVCILKSNIIKEVL